MSLSIEEILKEIRKLDLYSQEFITSYLNFKRQTYSPYEPGRIELSAETLYQLSLLYNTLNQNELEMLSYYCLLDSSDKEDIMDFAKIKCRRKNRND